MKNPVTFSVYEARSVQKKRQLRQILLLSGILIVLLSGIFFVFVLIQKDKIDRAFPSGTATVYSVPETGPATSEETTAGSSENVAITDATSEVTALSESSTSASTVSTDSTDTSTVPSTTETTVVPVTVPTGDILIPTGFPLQTVSHKTRDAAFHKLQKGIQKYVDGIADTRIGLYYINLKSSEAFGYNDMLPFAPSGAFAVPVNLCLYRMFAAGTASPTEIMTYLPEDGESSESTVPAIGQYDLRTLSYLSLAGKDNVALNMVIRRQNNIDDINNQLRLISGIIDYRTPITYADYKGAMFSGKNRSCPQDLAKYMQAFYLAYMQNPTVYQAMFNDLSGSADDWGVGVSFPDDVLVCHRTGSDGTLGCETDVALVFAQEPFVLSVQVECADPVRAREIQSHLGTMIYDYLATCYA